MSNLPKIPGFIVTEQLGTGSYATVYKAFKKGEERQVVAVKCVEKSSLTKSATDNLLTEIRLLKKLKHEFIVQMKDFLWDEKHIFIILEYCSGGDLSKFIRSSRTLPEAVVKRFLQQLAKALQFLRSENVCHMDLKPQNILLSSVQDPVLKLADFGFAQYLRHQDDATSLRGSPLYMAPEILLKHKYDARVDLWSVGVILYECLFGQAPYSSKTFAGLIEKIKNPKPIQVPYGVNISGPCRNLLIALLERDPDKRITYDEFFRHEFLDMEHMPSPSCYPRAVERFVDAVEQDKAKDYAQAINHYCEALRYFVPAIQYEKDPKRKEMMRSRAKDYMNRAEQLKTMLKPKFVHASVDAKGKENTTSLEPEFGDAHEQSAVNPRFMAALRIARVAQELEQEEKFEEALDKYRLALESMMLMLSDEPKGLQRDLLTAEIQQWMDKAESIQAYLSVKALHINSPDSDPESMMNSSLRQQCCLQ